MGGRKCAEEFSGGVGVDRPSVRADERCYTDKGMGNCIGGRDVYRNWRSVGEVKVAAFCDRDDRATGDHKIGGGDGGRLEDVGKRFGEVWMQQNAAASRVRDGRLLEEHGRMWGVCSWVVMM